MTQNKKSFSHIFDFCFSVDSQDYDFENVSPEDLRNAILKRVHSLDNSELLEACGFVDTDEYK